MSKDRKFDREASEILGEEKKFKQRKRKFKARCTHVTPKGKTRLESTKEEHVRKCNRCGTKVDFSEFVEDRENAMVLLNDSIDRVKNACNIIKHRAAIDGDDKRSQSFVDFSANLLLDLDAVPEILESLTEGEKSKKNKKKEKRREIKVGLDALAFGKKKKSKGGW